MQINYEELLSYMKNKTASFKAYNALATLAMEQLFNSYSYRLYTRNKK